MEPAERSNPVKVPVLVHSIGRSGTSQICHEQPKHTPTTRSVHCRPRSSSGDPNGIGTRGAGLKVSLYSQLREAAPAEHYQRNGTRARRAPG